MKPMQSVEPPLTAYPPHMTERLSIRPLRPSDAEALQVLTDDPAITERVIFLPSPFTLADGEAVIGSNDEENCFLGIWLEDALIGVVGTHLRPGNQLEIGYWFGPAVHRRGYATEAVSAVMAKVREIYPDRQLIAQCVLENKPSWNLLHKLGFRPTGEPGQWAGRALLKLADC